MSAEDNWSRLKNVGVEAKRAVDRARQSVMQKVGLVDGHVRNDEFDRLVDVYLAQHDALRKVKGDSSAALDALCKLSDTTHMLAVGILEGIAGSGGSKSESVIVAAETAVAGQQSVADEVVRRAEKRIRSRVLAPVDEELMRGRDVGSRLEGRKSIVLDYERYRARMDESGSLGETQSKTEDKEIELQAVTQGLEDTIRSSIPKRKALLDACLSETIEFQRRYYSEAGRCIENVVDTIGEKRLDSMRLRQGQARDDAPPRAASAKREPSIFDDEDLPSPPPAEDFTRRSSSPYTSDDDYGRVPSGTGRRETSSYPSTGVGQRETTGAAPRSSSSRRPPPASKPAQPPAGSFFEELSSDPSYGTSGSGSATARKSSLKTDVFGFETASSQPEMGRTNSAKSTRTAAPTTRSSSASRPRSGPADGDLLGDFTSSSASSTSRSKTKKHSKPTNGHFDAFMDNAASTSKPRPKTAKPTEGDLLGSFDAPRTAKPARAQPRSTPSSDQPKPAPARAESPSARSDSSSNSFNRSELQQKHADEIQARADEKLAAVREREQAAEKEQSKKDSLRAGVEMKINMWTASGQRRGNLRALLASLDTIIWPNSGWKAVTMDALSAPAKAKINYHKAILQVHPDKIQQKGLTIDQQVTAELIFDELKNAWEVFQCDQEGKPRPEGSVGPKGGAGRGMGTTPAAGGFKPGWAPGGGMPNYGGNPANMGGMGGGPGVGGMPGYGMAGRGMGTAYGGGMPNYGQGMGGGMGGGMAGGMPQYSNNMYGGRGMNPNQRR